MKRRYASGLVMTWLLLILATQAAGQPPMLYNPQTVQTVSGIVVSTGPAAAKEGLPEPVHLVLKTDLGNVTVLLGPNWFIDQQPVKIVPLDRIRVTGSRITLQGKPALVAAEVRKGEQVLKLRDEQGAPRWGSREKKPAK